MMAAANSLIDGSTSASVLRYVFILVGSLRSPFGSFCEKLMFAFDCLVEGGGLGAFCTGESFLRSIT